MGEFIERLKADAGYELCGRMLRMGDSLVMFIDGVGRFEVPGGVLVATLSGLSAGEVSGPVAGIIRRSESGKGLYLEVGADRYVTPVSRVRAVMEGRHRKGPMSRRV